MNILVAISRVPDTTTKILVGTDGKSIDNNNVKFILNPYDEYALEEALQIREKNGGTVTAITVGSQDNLETLRSALAMGADNAVLVDAGNAFDAMFVAKNIAEYAKQSNPDIIFLGKQSIDFDSFQVPSYISEFLDLPLATSITKLTLNDNNAIAEREIEGGKEVLELQLPAIFSANKGLNNPRYPKLPDIMKAKKKPVDTISPVSTTPTITIDKMELPSKTRLNKIFTDSDEDILQVVKLLHEEAKIY